MEAILITDLIDQLRGLAYHDPLARVWFWNPESIDLYAVVDFEYQMPPPPAPNLRLSDGPIGRTPEGEGADNSEIPFDTGGGRVILHMGTPPKGADAHPELAPIDQ